MLFIQQLNCTNNIKSGDVFHCGIHTAFELLCKKPPNKTHRNQRSQKNTKTTTVERGRKRLTPIRRVSHFCPSQRLFCSAVFHLQNVLTEPIKKTVLNWADTHMQFTAQELQIRTDYILFHRGIPRSFSMLSMAFFENLIGFHYLDRK